MHYEILTEEEISLLNSYLSLFPATVSAQQLRDKFQDVIEDCEIRPIQLLSRRNTAAYLLNPKILDFMLKVLKDDRVQSILRKINYPEPTNEIVSTEIQAQQKDE